MKKSKFLKPFSFASLALLMGIAGTMAFAPLEASPSVANASETVETTTEQGLITPKADDPIIYTTESGIEIKWGNAPNLNSSLSEGNLNGFPYFTTSKSGTTYTWVIIGRNTNDDVFLEQITHHLFSSWKTNNSKHSGTYENKGYYFFNNTYESTTPAGSAINGVVPSKSYVADVTKVTKTIVGTEEIPSGCVLILLNVSLDDNTHYHTSSYLTARDQCFDGVNNIFKNKYLAYFENDTFGFGDNLNHIQNTTVHQTNQYYNGGWQQNIQNSTDLYFFPMATGRYSTDNFSLSNYLTQSQRAEKHQQGRSTFLYNGYQHADWFYQDGTVWPGSNTHSLTENTASRHHRPACVIKFS